MRKSIVLIWLLWFNIIFKFYLGIAKETGVIANFAIDEVPWELMNIYREKHRISATSLVIKSFVIKLGHKSIDCP